MEKKSNYIHLLKSKNYAMCTIIIQEAYCISQNSHIQKNKLINKQ